MTIPLQRGIIYGPVNSRRLGRSLGINLLPLNMKICTFNCVYCQYGWTRVHDWHLDNSERWPAEDLIYQELRKYLKTLETPPAYLTFSGNGEPTLHPDFPRIVEEVTAIRDEVVPSAKTAVLSNSTTVTDSLIRTALEKLDVPVMKLDCGNSECFQRYNQPVKDVSFPGMIEGLAAMKNVTLQSLFATGPSGNFSESDIESWIEQVQFIRPQFVQIYTLDRGTPSKEIYPADYDKLEQLGQHLRADGIPCQVFTGQ